MAVLYIDAVELIPLDAAILKQSVQVVWTKQPTDNLILHCILAHARRFPNDEKGFLSGNIRDFASSAARAELATAGVAHYFSRAEAALAWIESLQ